jgi:hypothetical protein
VQIAPSVINNTLSRGAPWVPAGRGRPGPRSRPQYTQEDCLGAIHACATALEISLTGDGWVSADLYDRWSRAEHRRARELGLAAPRLPRQGVIYRLWKSWPRAVEAAKREVALGDAGGTRD